jgi:hypothetical protein
MNESFKEILQKLGYEQIAESSKELRMRPVYRDSDNNTVLVVYKDNGHWIDFARGASGSFEELIKLSLNLSSIEDAKLWLQKKDIVINKSNEPRAKITTPKIFDKEILLKLQKDYSYWEKRGISKNTLEKFGGGVAQKGKMAGRYVFPVYNSKDELVGFSGRDVYNNSDRCRWKHLGVVSQWVFPAFLNSQQIKENKSVILLESIGDLLSLFECGITNCLVIFGLNLSNNLLGFLIKNDCQKIIISLNNDANKEYNIGDISSQAIYNKLRNFFDEAQLFIRLPKLAKDWNDVLTKSGKEEIQQVFKDMYGN